MKQNQFIRELSKLNPSSTFLTLSGYKSDNKEVADYNIVFHISYYNAIKRSIAILEKIKPEDTLHAQAKNELLDGYNKSLRKMEETPFQEEAAFTTIQDAEGKSIKGIKQHNDTGELHIYGLFNSKRVVTPGIYKRINKRPLTIAKDKYRKLCPASKFRQFVVSEDRVDHIAVGNISLLPPELNN